MRRTSTKAFFAAAILCLVGIIAMNAAEARERAPGKILFSHGTRPWNGWDIVWTSALMLSVSAAVTGFMFLHKDD